MTSDIKKKDHPKSIEPLYDKNLTCLYCEKKFTSKQVRTNRIKLLGQDSDYCPHYEGENPIFYEAFICPHCGFAFTQSFNELTPGKREIIEKNYIQKLKEIPNYCGHRTWKEAIRAFNLAALSSYLKGENEAITGHLFLRIAWIYRYVDEKEKEKRFLKKALDFYNAAYLKGSSSSTNISEYQLLYLMGDIYTRLDHYQEASKIFSQLFSDPDVPPKIRSRAIDTWNQYKENQQK